MDAGPAAPKTCLCSSTGCAWPAQGCSASRNVPAIVLSVGMSLPQASGVRPLHGVLMEWRWQRKGRKYFGVARSLVGGFLELWVQA